MQTYVKEKAENLCKQFSEIINVDLDYSIESLRIIDSFIEQNSGEDSVFAEDHTGQLTFSIGCYVGETLVRNLPGAVWILPESLAECSPDAVIIQYAVHDPDGSKTEYTIWPMDKTLKRLHNGEEDSLWAYAHVLMSKTDVIPNQEPISDEQHKKPWWKFW